MPKAPPQFEKDHGLTLVEALTVIVILGIVLFITLPHLTQSHETNDVAAMKAKATQLNQAKAAWISFVGLDSAQTIWTNTVITNQSKYAQIVSYLPQGVNPASGLLSDYVVPGFTLSMDQNASVAAPVIIAPVGGSPIAY